MEDMGSKHILSGGGREAHRNRRGGGNIRTKELGKDGGE
jgi:hypothetical protein